MFWSAIAVDILYKDNTGGMVSVCLKRGYQYLDAIESRYKNPQSQIYIDVPFPRPRI